MFKLIKKAYPFNLTFLSLLIATIAIDFFHKHDVDLKYSWMIFYLWLIVFIIGLIYAFLVRKFPIKSFIEIVSNDKTILIILLSIATLSRLLFIGNYPYVQIGDGLRDGGLTALRIGSGEIKDLFDWGSYEGFGLFVPLIAYFFSFVFSKELIYLIPTAIVGIMGVFFIYVTARQTATKKVAIVAAVFLIGSLISLHYSRSELVVNIDSLLSLLLILTTYAALSSETGYLLAGLLYGFSLHFYAGIRGMILICVSFLLVLKAFRAIKLFWSDGWSVSKKPLYNLLIGIVVLAAGIIIGLGPRVNHLSWQKFTSPGFHKFALDDDSFLQKKPLEKLSYLKDTYTKAFLVYFSESTNAHFPLKKPILDFPINWFFLAGLFYLILDKKLNNSRTNLLIFIVLALPLFNQVLVGEISADHRLMSFLPPAIIIAAFGTTLFFERIIFSPTYRKNMLMLFLSLFLLHQLWFYFFKRPSDVDFGNPGAAREYLLQSVADYISADKYHQAFYILRSDNVDLQLQHLEKFQFFAYPRPVALLNSDDFFQKLNHKTNMEIFITLQSVPQTTNLKKQVITTNCQPNKWLPNYRCPQASSDNYSFNVLK